MKKHSEEYNQIWLVSFLKKVRIYNQQNNLPDFEFWHTPNGGKRDKITAGQLKLMGVLAGVLDLAFIWEKGLFFIELKDKNDGSLSKSQIDFMDNLDKFNIPHHTVYAAKAPEMIKMVGDIILSMGLTNQNGISKASEEALGGWSE